MHQCIKLILFWGDNLHVSDGLSVRHQEFKTVHTATGICQTNTAACLQKQILLSACSASRQQYLFDICLLLYIQSWTPGDGRKDRPKHVECLSKINIFDALVHLVGCTIGILLRCTALWTSDIFLPYFMLLYGLTMAVRSVTCSLFLAECFCTINIGVFHSSPNN